MPFAPVGGTMCAASPARKSRPRRMGSATTLRIPVTLFSRNGPSLRVNPSAARRVPSSSQTCASDQAAGSVSGGTCRYRRVISGLRIEYSAKPFGWWE